MNLFVGPMARTIQILAASIGTQYGNGLRFKCLRPVIVKQNRGQVCSKATIWPATAAIDTRLVIRTNSRRHSVSKSLTPILPQFLQHSPQTRRFGSMSDEVAKAQTAQEGQDTIFGKILRGEIPCKFIYEDDQVVAFDDINPVAKVHFLVIPRKPISMMEKATETDEKLLGHMMLVGAKVAKEKGITEGFRYVINNGRHGCQSVYHLHLHVLGGQQLGWPPC